MTDKLEINSIGEASFKYSKRGFQGGITAHGTIKYFDNEFVLFEDFDKFRYLVKKENFNFKKHESNRNENNR